jgi:hypothetical protein
MAKFISAYRALGILYDAVYGWLPIFPLRVSELSEEEGEALLSGVAMMIKSILDCSTYDVPAGILRDNGIIENRNDEKFKTCADKQFSEFAEFVHKIIAEAKISRGEAKKDELR